jgi:DNA-binding NtrC family response regulator
MTVPAHKKTALVVHPELTMLSKYQALLAAEQFTTIVARDLPTALLAITQHYFDVAIVSSQLGESGDGWPLAGVIHLVFPKSYVGVLVPGADLLALQSAINNGVQEVYENDRAPEAVVSSVLGSLSSAETKAKRRSTVQ